MRLNGGRRKSVGAIGIVSESTNCNWSAETTAACGIRATASSSIEEQKRKRCMKSGSRRNQGTGAREEYGIGSKKWRWCAQLGSRDASGVQDTSPSGTS